MYNGRMDPILPRVACNFLMRGFDPRGAVACSGGPDSVALLLAFHESKLPVIVAHVNHQLRGAESDADEEFVRELAERMKLPFFSTRIELPKVNQEDTARSKRYEWFATLDAKWIATGHTADDQAETVLHRLIRGSGLQGLQSIHEEIKTIESPSAATGGLPVVRPLLSVSRSEILSYLQERGQPYRTDSSNADPKYTRNRIRQDLLPLLKEFNPNIVNALCRTACQAREAFHYIRWMAKLALEDLERPRAGSLLIFDGLMLTERTPRIIRREVLRLVWQREGWPLSRMTSKHWNRLGRLDPGDYPGGIRLRHKPPVVQLGPWL